MRNRNMFRSEGRGMGQRCGMGRRFAMNSEEVAGVSSFAEQAMGQAEGRAQGFTGQGLGRGQGGQGRGRAQGFGRRNRCR